jgi:hypothetical protein
MISPYETQSIKLTENIIDVINTCQYTAEQEGVEIIAYALEHARTSLLLMVRFATEREKLFNDYISNIAEGLGACDSKEWQKNWQSFVENGGVCHD